MNALEEFLMYTLIFCGWAVITIVLIALFAPFY